MNLTRIECLYLVFILFKFCTNREIDPLWYLKKFGYINTRAQDLKLSESLVMYPKDIESNNEFTQAIKRFQKFANLNVTGHLDRKTLEIMKLPRCGHPDVINQSLINRTRRYALQGSKWLKTFIRYKVSKYPMYSTLSRYEIDEEINRAFKLWSSVSQLNFEQVFDDFYANQAPPPADIEIKFETGYHGDSEPFDGPGFILGHAYFPQFGGNTHFDAEEAWSKRSTDGVNLYQVAVHEFGHALGLEHSDNFDAIMAPFFRGYSEQFMLHNDDITAIQYLYGKKSFQKTPTRVQQVELVKVSDENARHDEVNNQDLCTNGQFDAILVMSDDYTYIFKNGLVYRLDENFNLDKSYPRRVRSLFGRWDGLLWMTLPDNLDTAFHVRESGKSYFFKGPLYWRTTLYDIDPGYPKSITENFKGLNYANGFEATKPIDAAFMWGGNSRVYFVQEDRYWRYDMNRMEIERGYPKSLSIWRGLPSRISDAVLWINGVTYFFDNDVYYRFNDLAFKVDDMSAYPRRNVDAWFGCQNNFGNLMLNNDTSKTISRINLLDDKYVNASGIGVFEEEGAHIESTTNDTSILLNTIIKKSNSKVYSGSHCVIKENNYFFIILFFAFFIHDL